MADNSEHQERLIHSDIAWKNMITNMIRENVKNLTCLASKFIQKWLRLNDITEKERWTETENLQS